MSRPRGLQGSKLTLKTSVGCLPAPLLQCSKQQTKHNNQQNQPISASSSKKTQRATKTSNDSSKGLATLPTNTANQRRNLLKSNLTIYTQTHQLAMHHADVKCCSQEACKATQSRKPLSACSPTMLQVRKTNNQQHRSTTPLSQTTAP